MKTSYKFMKKKNVSAVTAEAERDVRARYESRYSRVSATLSLFNPSMPLQTTSARKLCTDSAVAGAQRDACVNLSTSMASF